MVTPTYYVLFTFCTLVTSIILFQGLDASPVQIVTLVLGFLTICAGITLLQISKIDPDELAADKDEVGIDRSTTLLIRASRSHISHEKGSTTAIEDPGVDTVRGGLGVIGSIVRARSMRKMHHASSDEYRRMADEHGGMQSLNTLGKSDLNRYELHDRPMPLSPTLAQSGQQLNLPHLRLNMPQKRDTTISFVSGSAEPHGHHGNLAEASSSSTMLNPAGMDGRPSSTFHRHDSGGGRAGSSGGGILMSPTSSNVGTYRTPSYSAAYGTDDLEANRRNSIRRIPRSEEAGTLSKVWGDTPSKGDCGMPMESLSYDDSEGVISSTDFAAEPDEDDSSQSSPVESKRRGKIFPLGSIKTQSKDRSKGSEKVDLLSPVMRSDMQFNGSSYYDRNSRS